MPCQEQHGDVITKCALKSTWYKGLLQGFRPAKHSNTRVTLSVWAVVSLVSTTLHMCLSALLDRGPHLTDNSGYALNKEPLWHRIFHRKTCSFMQSLELSVESTEPTEAYGETLTGFGEVGLLLQDLELGAHCCCSALLTRGKKKTPLVFVKEFQIKIIDFHWLQAMYAVAVWILAVLFLQESLKKWFSCLQIQTCQGWTVVFNVIVSKTDILFTHLYHWSVSSAMIKAVSRINK